LYVVSDDGLIYGFSFVRNDLEQTAYYTQYSGSSYSRNFQENTIFKSEIESGFLEYAYNYPNPAGQFTNIRFETSQDSEINLRFYDLAGRLIYETSVSSTGGMPGEFRWDLEELPSGVYHCRLEANSDGRSDVSMWNIAVVK
jgi:hypothetical protein